MPTQQYTDYISQHQRNMQKQKPNFEYKPVDMYRPNIWMEQMDRTTSHNPRRDMVIMVAVLLACLILYSLAPGFTFEDIFVKGGVK